MREQCTFPKETLQLFGKTYVPNIFVITIISFLFLYVIMTYHWKGFEKNYNFVGGNTSIKIHMKKLRTNKNLNTFVP
jgi:hypothetical protein